MASRLLSFLDREPDPRAITDPSSAQFQLWLAQMLRDHGMLSDREMGKFEDITRPLAGQSKTLLNPFTGEIRKIDSNGHLLPR